MTMIDLAQAVLKTMKAYDLSAEAFAREAGCTSRTVHNILAKKCRTSPLVRSACITAIARIKATAAFDAAPRRRRRTRREAA